MISFQISSWVPAEFWSLQTLLAVICVYLYGSIPFAYLFTYLFKKQRLTDKGTGNIGVANAFGVGGLKAGFLTVLCEASKVVVPIAIARYYYDAALAVTLIFVVISILGTSYSIFLKGKGGQGGTILLWALLLLSPYTLLAFLVGFIIIYFVIRNRYYTSLIGHVLLPVELFLIEGNLPFVIFGVFAAIFYSLRYKPQKSDYSHYKKDMKLLRFLEEKFIKKNKYIIPINKAKDPSRVGMKAQKLHYLKKAGFRIPQTYVCKFAAYDEYRSGDENVLNRLGAELEGLPLNGRTFGIRSSANVEDGEDLSFAGQFESYLDVGSVSQVLNAMVKVWDSAKGERVMAYLSRASLSQSDFKMAAIIQEMVKARCSGVAFTKNPVSGFDEVIVEAVNGLGDRLLQGQVKPLRWVNKWGKWLEQPQDGEIDRELIARVVSEAREIAKKYGTPVDLEWAYDGEELYWLQRRAITALKGINIYSNKISKEFMPGIVKPLIWSVNIPVVNSSWKRLFVELLGKDARSIDIYNLAKSFYYRAYFNMGVLGDIFELLGMPRELLEMLLGIDVSAGKGPRFRPGIKTVK